MSSLIAFIPMTRPRPPCVVWRIPSSVAAVIFTALCFVLPVQGASEPATRAFDLPGDTAAKTLRQFANQSGLDVVFATEATANVQTNPVKGNFAPREAINRLLAGTGLIAEQNPRTGALTILRSPNERRVAQAKAGDRPVNSAESAPATPTSTPAPTKAATGSSSSSTTDDSAVLLSPFEVRTEKDTGYIATNTLAGSRLNTRLVDTPASISVMTKDFLNDIGALSVSQAMEYALSAATTSAAAAPSSERRRETG